MEKSRPVVKTGSNRRKFLRNGMLTAGAATMSAGLLAGGLSAFGGDREDHSPVTKGDIAILRFLNALEQIEADLWLQYTRRSPGQRSLRSERRESTLCGRSSNS